MTEAGFLSGYFANYYLRGDDQKQPDETFLTVYGSASVRFEAGPGDLEIFAGGNGAFAVNNSRADNQAANGGLQYELGTTQATLEYRRMQNRVFGDEDDATFYDVDTGSIRLRQRIWKRFSLEGAFALDNRKFHPPDTDRDSLTYEFEGGPRWEIANWLTLRGSVGWAFRRADSSRYDWETSAFAIAAEIDPSDASSALVRYRRRWRDYTDASPGDVNFNRNDEIDDVTTNIRYRLTDIFGLQLQGAYRHNESDRPDRNYDAWSVAGGVFVTFGNKDR